MLGIESNQIQRILLAIQNRRQMVMTSSIWSDIVRCFIQKFMANPIKVYVNTSDSAHSIDNNYFLEPKKKPKRGKNMNLAAIRQKNIQMKIN